MIQRFRNFGWLGADEIVRLAAGFLVTLLLAQHLGPDGFGAYGYVLGLAGLFAPVTLVGLDSFITKQIVEDNASAGRILASAMALRCPASLLAGGLAIGTMAALPPPDGTSLALVAIAAITLIALPFQTPNLLFKAIERPRTIAVPRIAVTLLTTIAMVMLILGDEGLQAFVELRAIEAVLLGAAAMAGFVSFRHGTGPWRVEAARLRPLLVNGIPLMLAGIGAAIYMRIDQLMLGQMTGISELGYYTLAVRVSDSALFVPIALQAAFFPAIVKAQEKGSDAYLDEMRVFFAIMSLAMAGMAGAVVVAGALIVGLFVGTSFAPAIPMIAVLALALPFVGLGVARTSHLTVRGWFWTAPAATALGALVNITLNLLLIPRYAGLGAAVATVISYGVAVLGTCFLFPWLRDIGRTMLSSLNPLFVFRTLVSLRSDEADAPR
jgi:polysaccharide transporter, PST family